MSLSKPQRSFTLCYCVTVLLSQILTLRWWLWRLPLTSCQRPQSLAAGASPQTDFFSSSLQHWYTIPTIRRYTFAQANYHKRRLPWSKPRMGGWSQYSLRWNRWWTSVETIVIFACFSSIICQAKAQIPVPALSIPVPLVAWHSFDWKRPSPINGWGGSGIPLAA